MAKVVILSGAGISAESGISTFRASDGLWNNHKIEEICLAGCMSFNRAKTVAFYDDLRTSLKAKLPNKAHIEIAKLTCKYPNDISVITQNIDDLFEKADCKNLTHLHGFLPELYCEHCGEMVAIEYQKQYDAHDVCPNCNKDKLRPNIVFFHEQAPMYKNLYEQMEDCEVFVVIGTSGNVINTDMFLNPKIKLSILNNLEHSSSINDGLYTKAIFKPATQAIDEIIEMVEKFLSKVDNQY